MISSYFKCPICGWVSDEEELDVLNRECPNRVWPFGFLMFPLHILKN